MINRLIEPTDGHVLINGNDTQNHDPVTLRREIGYIIQDIGLFPHYTIEENVAVVPKLLGWSQADIQTRTEELMERLKLPFREYAAKLPHQLSGGQQQRVGIARALAADPPIILMDEPFGALDPITRKDIRRDFMELEELSSKTSILVTHDIEEAFEMADVICLLDKGEVQQTGTSKELLFQPANPFVKKFLIDKLTQLEFQAILIADIFDDLPDEGKSSQAELEIKPKQSIFDALKLFINQPSGTEVGVTHFQGQSKYYRRESLMDVFHRFIVELKK